MRFCCFRYGSATRAHASRMDGLGRTAPRVALLRLAGSSHWDKNLLLIVAPAAAGTLTHRGEVLTAIAGVVVFTVGTAAVSIFARALAGRSLRGHRYVVASVLAAAASALAFAISVRFGDCVSGYLLLAGGYLTGLREVVMLKTPAVAAGLLVRVCSGVPLASAYPSSWLLFTAACGAAVLVLARCTDESGHSFVVVWQRQMLTLAIAATVLGYAGWALAYVGRDVAVPLLMLSLLPFLFGLVRSGTRPARAATGVVRKHDAVVLAAWTLWGVTAAGALYLA